MKKFKIFRLVITLLFFTQCTHSPRSVEPAPKRVSAALDGAQSETKGVASLGMDALRTQLVQSKDWLLNLPGGDGAEYFKQVDSILIKQKTLDTATRVNAGKRIAKYIAFLMYESTDTAVEKTKLVAKVLSRLTRSSTQFILCQNINDFSCLEKPPVITPASKFRVEDPKLKLGERQVVPYALGSRIKGHFNNQIFVEEDKYDYNVGVGKELEKLIKSVNPGDENSAIYMSLYGMDDITDEKNYIGAKVGSLKTIYDAILEKHEQNVPIFSVFDQTSPHKTITDKNIIFSYRKPAGVPGKNWILSPLIVPILNKKTNQPVNGYTNMNFMYNGGTQGLVKGLNSKITTEDQASARLEWPDAGIMHNKFFIFQNGNDKTLWTGTANISRTCLGTERNSNLSVVIKENNIADIYLKEFNEMYDFDKTINTSKPPPVEKIAPTAKETADTSEKDKPNKARLVGVGKANYYVGRFHTNKRPNTKRYLHFADDDVTARIYFSPTDDGEHRALLPMLHSALPGDRILISMFGAAGIEYVRAMQLAAARGVEVQVIVDSPTACGSGSWAGRSGDATLLEDNPFDSIYKKGIAVPVVIKKNNKESGEVWKQNHQKIGLLLRNKGNNEFVTAHFSFGSQNWSESGNDKNDENMIVLSSEKNDIEVASDFAKHFSDLLWPKATVVETTGCKEVEAADPDDPDTASTD